MFDLEPTEEQQLIKDTIASFAAAEIRPIARDCDETGSIPKGVIDKGYELGLIHSRVSRGSGRVRRGALRRDGRDRGGRARLRRPVDRTAYAGPPSPGVSASRRRDRRSEAASPARADPGLHPGHRSLPRAHGSTSIRTTSPLVPRPRTGTTSCRGTSASSRWPRTRRHSWSTAGTQTGTGAFLVERNAPGLTVGEREKNMGIKALATHEVVLEGVRVPASARIGGDSAVDLTHTIDRGRIAIAAMAVGLARSAFDFARDYAKERKAFGVPIAQKQAIAFILADNGHRDRCQPTAGVGGGLDARPRPSGDARVRARQALRRRGGAQDRRQCGPGARRPRLHPRLSRGALAPKRPGLRGLRRPRKPSDSRSIGRHSKA